MKLLFEEYPWERHRPKDKDLSDSLLNEICDLYESGIPIDDLAQEYGISERQVQLIVTGHVTRHG